MNVSDYIDKYYKGNRNLSLDSMKFFMDKYNNFEKDMKFIHIAGTNGKGSTVQIISKILEKEGYKVGKFLSPHLSCVNERISINGKDILDKDLKCLIEELKPIVKEFNKSENKKVSRFELILMIALLYFYRNKVDFVILETGVGGLNDATNIISLPLVSVITSIGLDHMALLGDTLEKITYQKIGIIKENSNTVVLEQSKEIEKIIKDECISKNNNLVIVKEDDILNYNYDEDYQYFDYKDIKNLCTNLKGKMQINNICICIEIINILNKLGYKVSKKSILEGIKNIVNKGRMEVLNKKPLIIFDGAHNEPAIKNLEKMVDMYFKNRKRVYIISILKRKDYKSMLKELSLDKEAIFIVTSGNDDDRYVLKEELYDFLLNYTNNNNVLMLDLNNAIDEVYNNYKDQVTLVIGSLYVYKNVKEKIDNNK